MKVNWEEVLHEGEKVLWQGSTESYETLDKTHKSSFITKSVISAAVALLIIIAYVIAAQQAGVKPLLILIVLLIASIGPINVLLDGKRLHDVVYAATDSRLLVLRDDAKAVEYSKIPCAEFRKDPDGHTSLLCGQDALKSKPSKWRQFTVVGPRMTDGDEPVCECFALYAVKDIAGLRAVLKDRLPSLKG